MKIFFLQALIFLFFLFPAFGQKSVSTFEYFTTKDGLSNNIVRCILQDREGFMWFGTEDGLNKFDGHTFTVFRPDPSDTENSLRGSVIWDIHEDKAGRLWVATYEGGLQQVDKQIGKVTAYPIDSANSSRWDELFSISEDKKGKLWLGTEKGLVLFDPDKKTVKKYPSPTQLFHSEAMALLQQDADGGYWACNIGGIFQFDIKRGSFRHYPLSDFPPDARPLMWAFHLDAEGIAWLGTGGEGLFKMDTRNPGKFIPYQPDQINDYVNALGIYEADGYLWISSSEGLQRVNKKTSQIATFRSDPSRPGSLSSNDVRSVYKDRGGNLWVGTGSGINLAAATAKLFSAHQIIPTPSPFYLGENYVNAILEDSAANLLVANFHQQLFLYDLKSKEIEPNQESLLGKRKLVTDQANVLHLDRKGQLWVGTPGVRELRLLNIATGAITSYPCEIPVEGIEEDHSGKLWIMGWRYGIASFDPLQITFTYYKPSLDSLGLLPASVQDVMVSRTGEIWIGTYAGLSRLDPKSGQFKNYVHHKNGNGQLNDYKVLFLYEDRDGFIWAGTNKGGLNRLDPETDTFTYFTTTDGLPSNHIRSIAEDGDGNLWIGTNRGLSRFNPKRRTIRNYDISDGLPDNEFIKGSVYSRNGKLMFGTRNGFIIFYPDSIRDNAPISPVYITSMKVMGRNRDLLSNKIALSHQENFLLFDFVALNYPSPEKNQYAYQLVGLDKDWVYSGTRRFANYTNLDPGEYVFRVKASNNDGVWNEQEAFVQILIMPPWWKTWWAYCLYGMLGVGLLLLLRQYTLNRERLKHDLQIQRLEAEKMHELDQLKSRFFANISHEFRTPLTLILGPLETFLKGERQQGKDQHLYHMMHRNGKRLLHLINQLLDLSRLEAARLKLETKPGAVVPFLRAIVLSFSSLAEREHIYFSASFPHTNPIVSFDADKLEKIITNLLSNALKFTPAEGWVEVLVSLQHLPQEEDKLMQLLEVKVIDSGVGVPEEDIQKIFDRFYQVDGSHTREREGSGIGLALTKELVLLHGGDIEVKSTVGKGSAFTVKLPLFVTEQTEQALEALIAAEFSEAPQLLEVHEPEQEQATAQEHQKQVKPKAPVVLLVDNHSDVRFYVRESLGREYRIMEASHGLEALAMATEHIPDLVISDLMMPLMDGVTLCRELKTDIRTSHIPVILLTAKAGEESKIEGLETGADDYLTKPFHVEELRVRVKNLLRQRTLLRERFSKKITVEPKEVTVTSTDEKFLQKALALIEANIADAEFDVETFGREMAMSRMHLHRKLKALTDQSPSDFIRAIRMKRAALLLEKRGGNISEIAFSVGFNSLTYFTRCFRQTYGLSPSEYLQRRAQNEKPV